MNTGSIDSYFNKLPKSDALLPKEFPNPFFKKPTPIAEHAARLLMSQLEHSHKEVGNKEDRGGKMFGVLIVKNNIGELGWIKGFSGQLEHDWTQPGFVPPLFEPKERSVFWPQGEQAIVDIEVRLNGAKKLLLELQSEYSAWRDGHEQKRTTLFDTLRKKREHRRKLRHHGVEDSSLDKESKDDSRQKREFKNKAEKEDATWSTKLEAQRSIVATIKNEQKQLSNTHLQKLFAGYQIHNPKGDRRCLLDFGDSKLVPGGTGDCAGAKLLGFANRHHLTPIAMTEFWWGKPPKTGGRWHQEFYPSCKGKCGLLLPYLLDGIPTSPPPSYASTHAPTAMSSIVFEDRYFIVAEKPSGVLSVPGKGPNKKDSLLTRLRSGGPKQQALLHVHRLDQATSGLMIFAKTSKAQKAMARLFNYREITKEYTALIEGEPLLSEGLVRLPIAKDWHNRPRQIVDETMGKPSETLFNVVGKKNNQTRVRLTPITGRTHQLRVHCAHPQGLGCPIVGDTIYGIAKNNQSPRLLLHATKLSFKHPFTMEAMDLFSKPPF